MDIETWVTGRFDRAAKYDNAELLDEDGVYTLHQLAAHIYALGFADGVGVQQTRETGDRMRQRAAERRDQAAADE